MGHNERQAMIRHGFYICSDDKAQKCPRSKAGVFVLKFDQDYEFARKNILCSPNGYQVKITKVYKFNWYRRLLYFFGIPFKMFNCVKVKEL